MDAVNPIPPSAALGQSSTMQRGSAAPPAFACSMDGVVQASRQGFMIVKPQAMTIEVAFTTCRHETSFAIA
jgi:hypothetical protein